MKKVIVIIILGIAVPLFGQETVTLSKIKLKDGSEFTAAIIENYPGKFIKIRITEEQVSTIYYTEIESIRDKNFSYNSEFILKRGFFMEGAYAFMFGKSGENGEVRVGMSLGLSANYRFKPYLSVGVGADVNALYVNSNHLLVPVYARISGSMAQKRIAPYYLLDVGWSAASTGDLLETNYEMTGGFMVRPEIGIRINNFRVGIGYQNQKVKTSYTSDLWWGDQQITEEERIMRNVRMGISLLF